MVIDVDEKVKALEAEMQATKAEIQQVLLDLRTILMEKMTPFQPESNGSAGRESDKGVEPDGNG